MKTRKITDKQCLRWRHEKLGRILDTRPWNRQEASAAQNRMRAEASAIRDRAKLLDPQTAYGPAIRIKDDRLRRDHHLSEAIASQDIRRHRDRLEREANIMEMASGSIPQERHDDAYITWMLDHIAAVEAYAYLVQHPDDYDGMKAISKQIHQRVGVGVEEIRIAARDCLDRWANLAGVPQWRKTYNYAGTL